MANEPANTRIDEGQNAGAARAKDSIEDPAHRHVGRTLESEDDNLDLPVASPSTPEGQIAADADSKEVDLGALDDRRYDPLSGRLEGDANPEPLKTRLPGDTSSDPHTDLGPDNATNQQHRRENAA